MRLSLGQDMLKGSNLRYLPAAQEGFPLRIFGQVTAKNIPGGSRRLGRLAQQAHIGFFRQPPAFAMVAGGAGSRHVGPDVFSTQPAWDHVIDG